MKVIKLKNKKLIFLIFLFLFNSLFNNINIKAKDNSQEINIQSEYLLGPTDSLKIVFRGIEFFSGFYNIDTNGNINLPELGKLNISGLTINELEEKLKKLYGSTILNAEINISIEKYRPISIYVSGEVKRPGLYKLNYYNIDTSAMPVTPIRETAEDALQEIPRAFGYYLSNNDVSNEPLIIPKLFDALKVAKGVTNYADLSKIKIIRENAKKYGGGKIETSIDFIKLLSQGDQSKNIRIYDGDSIIVSKSKNPIKDQILLASNSNLNPDKLTIFINGNVVNSGRLTVPKGSSLVQAIASAGGKKNFTGKVEFIRFKDFGETEKIAFKYNPSAIINSKKNPILMDGDIIFVRKTFLGKSAEFLNEISNPFVTGFGIYKIFND